MAITTLLALAMALAIGTALQVPWPRQAVPTLLPAPPPGLRLCVPLMKQPGSSQKSKSRVKQGMTAQNADDDAAASARKLTKKEPGAAAKQSREAAADTAADWGGLPAAMLASRCGAINNQITKAVDAESVLSIVEKHHEILNSVNTATALHRIASYLKKARAERDRVLRDKRFLLLVDQAIERSVKSNARSVSDLMWSCATLRYLPPPMLTPLLSQIAVHLERSTFEAQHLSLIVWAFAVLECKPVRLLEQIEAQSIVQLGAFNQQNCANLLWGFAKLNFKPIKLMAPMTTKLLEANFLQRLKPVEVSDAAFAVAMLGSKESQGELMAAFSSLAQPDTQLDRFSSRQLVMLIWAHARLGLRPVQLGSWLDEIRRAHEVQPLIAQDKKNLEAALGRFGEDAEWLNPPQEGEDEEPEVSEIEQIRAQIEAEKAAKYGTWQ